MSSNPSEFAKRVLSAFEAAGHATDEEVGDAGGPSTTTLAKYRKVAQGEMTMTEPRGDVMRRIDRAAGWRQGAARQLWRDGRDPEPPTEGRLLSLAESRPGRKVRVDSEQGFIQYLAERLTEVEERLDLLEAGRVRQAGPVSEADDTLGAAAKEQDIQGSGEEGSI